MFDWWERRRLRKAFSPYVGEAAVKSRFGESASPEEKELVCLVTRLHAFESLFARMPLREIGVLVNRYYELIADAVMQSQGDINRFCGPIIVAHFSYFEEVEDAQLVNAITSCSQASDFLESEFGVRLSVGLCRGTMLCGIFGSPMRKNFAALGPSLICAEQLALRDDPVNVCESTAAIFAHAAADPSISIRPHWQSRRTADDPHLTDN